VARAQLLKGALGGEGEHTSSVQATLYDTGCLVLDVLPAVDKVDIVASSVRYLPIDAAGGTERSCYTTIYKRIPAVGS